MEPTTVFIDPSTLPFIPAVTPPHGIRMVAGERRLGHGINNMLTVIYDDLDRLDKEGPHTLESRRAIESIRKCIDGILNLTRDAMQSNKPSRVSLATLAYDTLQLFRAACGHRNIEVDAVLAKAAHVVAAPAAISDSITNLIANAIEAMDTVGGRLTLHTDERDGFATVIVADTGRGMSKAMANRVFLEDFTTRPNGNGIGLQTVLAHVAEANGKINLITRESGGTSIELLFPAAE